MGQKNSQQSKLHSLMGEYDVIQQIKSESITFLEHKRTNDEFLLKQFTFNDRKDFEKTFNSLKPLKNKLAGSKHVVSLKQYLASSEDQYCSTFYKIYALFEYPQRTLDDEISERNLQKRNFVETQLWSILASCILGLSHLQKQSIKHSALKSTNILLSKEGIIKVCDPAATGQHSNYETLLVKRSTPHIYLAPEQASALQQQLISPSLNTYKGDIWTLGMIMLQAGLLEYQDDCYRDEYSRVHWETVHYNINRFGQAYSEQLKNMLEFMLSKDEKMRPDWIQLEEHVMKNNEENRNNIIQNQTSSSHTQPVSELTSSKPHQSLKSYQPPVKTAKLPPNIITTAKPVQNRGIFQQQSPRNTVLSPSHRTGPLNLQTNLPVSSSQLYSNVAPLKPSMIDLTRPLRNIFPGSVYESRTKADQNLVLIDEDDGDSNYVRQGSTQPFNYPTSEQDKQSNFGFETKKLASTEPLLDPESSKFVIQTFKLGSKYEGYKVNGMRHGQGKFFYQDGGMYDGNWKQNKMEGYGKLYYQSGKLAYEGEWKADQFKGKGILYNESPEEVFGSIDYRSFEDIGEYWTKYEGEFSNDLKDGKGTLYFSNGERFVGEFQEDLAEGWGRYYKRNGEVVEGKWGNNQLLY